GADHGPQGGNGFANGNPGPYRGPVGKGGDIAQSPHGLPNRAKTGLILVGPGLAKAGQAHQYQPGIEGVDGLPVNPQLFQHAGAEVLDQDIGFLDQLSKNLLTLG